METIKSKEWLKVGEFTKKKCLKKSNIRWYVKKKSGKNLG